MASMKKPTVNIIPDSETVNAFSLRSGTKQGCLLLSLPFNTVLEVLVGAVRQAKEKKESRLERRK